MATGASTSVGETIVVEVEGVSKRFVLRKEKSLKERLVNFGRSQRHREDFWALQDVDARIEAGTTVGLLGANGSGKSTLLKVIGGIIQPTRGRVRRRGRLAALLELGAGFHPDLTGRENLYLNASILGLSRAETDERYESIVEFSEIGDFIDTQVKFYSSGMYVRLAFAIAVHIDPDVLLVDEVLAVGDERFQQKCMDKIREFQAQGRTIVIVSHSAAQLEQLCDRGIVLRGGRVVFDGAISEALAELRRGFVQTGGALDDGSGRRVVDVRVVGPGEPGQAVTIRPGATLSLEVAVTASPAIEDGQVGFAIKTSDGQMAYATNTTRMRRRPGPLEGESTFRFVLPRVQLAQGSYSVTAALSSATGERFAQRTADTAIVVQDDRDDAGLVTIATEVVLPGEG